MLLGDAVVAEVGIAIFASFLAVGACRGHNGERVLYIAYQIARHDIRWHAPASPAMLPFLPIM